MTAKTTIRDKENLNPTPAAVIAMAIWGEEYSQQYGGSMDFWEKISPSRKRICSDVLARIIAAQKVHAHGSAQ